METGNLIVPSCWHREVSPNKHPLWTTDLLACLEGWAATIDKELCVPALKKVLPYSGVVQQMTQVILNFLCHDGVVVRRKWEQFYFYTFGGTCLGKRFSGGLPQLKPASTNVAIIHSLDSSSGPQKCHLPKEKGVFFCVPFTSCLETTDERVLGELGVDLSWTSVGP